jgi:hypothetical protein
MAIGARNTEQWREHRAMLEAISRDRAALADPAPPPADDVEEIAEPPAPTPWRDRLIAAALLILAALWIAAVATAFQTGAAPLRQAAETAALASGPLALIGIAYLLLQRTSRREARRFAGTASAMRSEAAALERAIARLGERIDANRQALSAQADELISLGDDSALRLTEIGADMRRETERLSRQAELLEKAAASAKADMATLHSDLPRIEAQVAEISALMAEAGHGAEQRAATLVGHLAELVAQSRTADATAAEAAERLVAQVQRVESAGVDAGARMDAVSARMDTAVNEALARTAEAVDSARQGIEATGAGLLAVIEQGSTTISTAGIEATAALSQRIETIGERLDRLATKLKAQDGTAQKLLAGLDDGLAATEQRFTTLGTTGAAEAERLAATIATLRGAADTIDGTLTGADGALDELIARSATLQAALDTATAAIARIEAQAGTGHSALAAMLPEATRLETAMAAAAGHLAEGEAAIARQRGGMESMAAAARERIGEAEEQARGFATLLADTGEQARVLADTAGPKLIDALLRVRDAANQAAERARETLSAVIPGFADAMGAATRGALDQAVGAEAEARVAQIAAAADQAVKAAQGATERLMRQMLTIAETTQAVETRIAEVKAEAEEASEENLSRRVALLIESLNSTAIDVAKILSNDSTDTAWAAYMKGDRGIFTRRAVRLIDATEAREIARHYEAEPEFREQVNRYIHDFEAMLRAVLATRNGSPLGVTLLSSDMGKLYVALAQAIERLRK